MARYADKTEVPVTRSRMHIESLLLDHEASGFHYGWDHGAYLVEFVVKNRQVRFTMPPIDEQDFLETPGGRVRSDTQVRKAVEQADRQRWRALYLVVRAKLEAVESGLAVFEEEFMAFIVMDNGKTIGDYVMPKLESGSKLLLTDGK